MDEEVIYTKTDKASEEIQNRTYKLNQKMRSLLIMIDGTKPINAYLEFKSVLGDVTSMLAELEQEGFIKKIEVVPKKQPAQPAAQTTAGVRTEAGAAEKPEEPEKSGADFKELSI